MRLAAAAGTKWLLLGAAFALLPGAHAKTVRADNVTFTTRACQPPHDTYDFCNTSLPLSARVASLIAELHDDEVPSQLTARHHGGGNPGPESNVSRIGLPTYGALRARCVVGGGREYMITSDSQVLTLALPTHSPQIDHTRYPHTLTQYMDDGRLRRKRHTWGADVLRRYGRCRVLPHVVSKPSIVWSNLE